MRNVRRFSVCLLLIGAVLFFSGCTKAPIFKNAEETGLFYTNPLGVHQIGDPFVMKDTDGLYYCYATSYSRGFMAWKSADLVEWEALGVVFNAMRKNQWASADFWAPEVVYNNGNYYMYYSGRWMKNSSLRIGVAVSSSPEGPFIDVLGHPLFDFGYAVIDAHVFLDDDGKKYLYFVRDCSENQVGSINESHIYGIELDDDLVSVTGEPVLLSRPEQAWETAGHTHRWNEGPFVLKNAGTYYLMYSANFFANKSYSVGYAVSDRPLGNFVKYEGNPILAADPFRDDVSGPGHNSVTVSPDGTELLAVYHTHTDAKIGGGDRQMAIDRLGFRADGTLYINGPSVSETPRPWGSIPYRNIAGEARIDVSSSLESKGLLADGSIAFYRKFAGYDWVPATEDTKPRISFTWDKPVIISSILVYPGAEQEASFSWTAAFDNGKPLEAQAFSSIPGSASIMSFQEMSVRSLVITVSPLQAGARLSEISILGTMF